MGFLEQLFKTQKKDIVLLLRKHPTSSQNVFVYKLEKKIKVVPGEEYKYQGRKYMPASTSNWFEKDGRTVHIVNVENQMPIPLIGNSATSFTAEQIDAYVSGNVLKSMNMTFGTVWEQNKTLIIMTLGSGAFIGGISMLAIMIFGAGA